MESKAQAAAEKETIPKVIGEATRYTVVVAFGLYAVGFLVWRSYLSKYGVSTVSFVQADYLSAAFCYALVVVTIGLPPFILVQWATTWAATWAVTGRKPATQDATIKTLVGVWGVLVFWLMSLFFWPGDDSGPRMFFFRVGLFAAFTFFYTLGVGKWIVSPSSSVVSGRDMGFLGLSCIFVIVILFLSSLDSVFLTVTLGLYGYFLSIPLGAQTVRGVWNSSGSLLRVIISTAMALVATWHIQYFGRAAFGDIPREVGGGKPEVAFVRTSSQNRELMSALGIGETNRVANSNLVFGPIAILVRSEKEILFLNPADMRVPANVTNVVTNLAVNIITNISTNRISYTTNTVPKLATNVVPNRFRPRARQIRSDLVEGMVFVEWSALR